MCGGGRFAKEKMINMLIFIKEIRNQPKTYLDVQSQSTWWTLIPKQVGNNQASALLCAISELQLEGWWANYPGKP